MRLEQNVDDQNLPHDLFGFLKNVSEDFSREYHRIGKYVKGDPGTAGDQGEENWAELLRNWLPKSYEVVTKGRILGHEGGLSPQIDVLVLRPGYPTYLKKIKHYLAGGVAAAFECKITLKPEHIDKAVSTSIKIRRLIPQRTGTPYKELNSTLIYGLLAHSYNKESFGSIPVRNVGKRLIEQDQQQVHHPREMLDMLCVADLGTWSASKTSRLPIGHGIEPYGETPHGVYPLALTAYPAPTEDMSKPESQITPIGILLFSLMYKMAWEDQIFRPFASEFQLIGVNGLSQGTARRWEFDIYSEELLNSWLGEDKTLPWDEWGITLR